MYVCMILADQTTDENIAYYNALYWEGDQIKFKPNRNSYRHKPSMAADHFHIWFANQFTQFQLFATMKMSLPIVFSFLGKHFSVLLAFSLPKNCKTN